MSLTREDYEYLHQAINTRLHLSGTPVQLRKEFSYIDRLSMKLRAGIVACDTARLQEEASPAEAAVEVPREEETTE